MIRRLMVPPLSQQVANLIYQLRSRFVSKVGFYLIYEPALRAGFFDKMLAFFKQEIRLFLVSGFSDCCIFTILSKYYSKRRFLTKKAP